MSGSPKSPIISGSSRTKNALVLGCFGLIFVMLAGCNRDSASSASASHPPMVIDKKDVPSDSECAAFTKAYELAVETGDGPAINSFFNWNRMLTYVTANVDVPNGVRESFMKGTITKLDEGGLAAQLARLAKAGGSVKLLRVRDVDGEKRALFRVLLIEGGVNYHDMVLARDHRGKVRAVDVYVFLSAERMTRTLRRLYVAVAAGESKSLIQKLAGAEGDFVRHGKKFHQMSTHYQDGEYQQALAVYETLPTSLQQEKSVMMMRIQAAMQVDEATYTEAIVDFRKAHPRDPCLDMISIDYYLVRKHFQAALDSVDRLEKSVGGDPYLNVLRANILVEKKELVKARALSAIAVKELPGMIESYWAMVNVTVAEGDFAETVQWLDKVEERFQVEFHDLRSVPQYAEFVQSPEYKKWRQTHRR